MSKLQSSWHFSTTFFASFRIHMRKWTILFVCIRSLVMKFIIFHRSLQLSKCYRFVPKTTNAHLRASTRCYLNVPSSKRGHRGACYTFSPSWSSIAHRQPAGSIIHQPAIMSENFRVKYLEYECTLDPSSPSCVESIHGRPNFTSHQRLILTYWWSWYSTRVEQAEILEIYSARFFFS